MTPRLRHSALRLIARTRQQLDSSAFGKRTLVMLGGTALGQAMGVLLAPVLTRLYTPEQFGALGVYMSAVTIAAVMGALCYEIAIPKAQNSTEAADMLAVCVTSLTITTGAVALGTAGMPERGLVLLHLDSLPHIRLLIPLGFAFIAAYHLMLYYAIWAQDFSTISRTRITQGFTGPLAQIALGLGRLGALGLCLGFILGQSTGTLTLVWRLVSLHWQAMREITLHGMMRAAWANRAFPLISSWAMMIDMAGAGQLAYVLAATYYPGPLAGFMLISERVVGRPLIMLSTSLLSVYMGEIGQTMKADAAGLRKRFLQVILRQFLIGAAWVVAVGVGASLAFAFLFGAIWADAVPFLLVLSIVYLLTNVVTSVGNTLQLLGHQAIAALWQITRVVAVIAGFALASHYHQSAFHAIVVYACIQSVACVIILLVMNAFILRLQRHLEIKLA